MEGTSVDRGQLVTAMKKIDAEVRDGLKHGHFEITITCSVGNKGVRELVLKAGKNHRYRIAFEDLKSDTCLRLKRKLAGVHARRTNDCVDE
jgi:hypothetical protein